jgi:hypothetical protein
MAARKYLVPIDLGQLEIRQAVAHLLGSAPGSPVEGQFFWNTATHVVEFYNGSSWINLGTLDQITAPAADVSLNSHKITNLATPTVSTDAATKAYVDQISQGVTWKQAVRVATTGAGTLASSFENGDTVDGVVLATGNRILIKDQATGAENGVYTVNASGAPTRATDFDASSEIGGAAVFVEEGTVNADSGWLCTTNETITLGSTSLVFAQFTGVGALVAGAGLTKTGSTVDVGAGTGISVAADSVAVDTSVVVRKFAVDVGDGAATSITVTHNLGTKDVTVQFYDNTTPFAQVEADVAHATTNTVTAIFAVAPTASQYRCVVHG